MYSDNYDNAPNFGGNFENDLQAEEGTQNSRLLKSKAYRQKIEDNVIALRNRISFLENEENKLLGKIEKTKCQALEVIRIKRSAKLHNQMVDNAKFAEKEYICSKKEEVHEMKEDLDTCLHEAYNHCKEANLSKADQVKASLNSLKGQYIEQKKCETRELIERCNAQKQFEKDLIDKKDRILVRYYIFNNNRKIQKIRPNKGMKT